LFFYFLCFGFDHGTALSGPHAFLIVPCTCELASHEGSFWTEITYLSEPVIWKIKLSRETGIKIRCRILLQLTFEPRLRSSRSRSTLTFSLNVKIKRKSKPEVLRTAYFLQIKTHLKTCERLKRSDHLNFLVLQELNDVEHGINLHSRLQPPI